MSHVEPNRPGIDEDSEPVKGWSYAGTEKVSGCLRTMTGARQFCAIRSYLSTAAKHGLSFFDALVMLTEGEPWMPAAA